MRNAWLVWRVSFCAAMSMATSGAAEPVFPEYDDPLTACPLCGSARLGRYDRDHRGVTIDRCRACGMRFMNPQYSDRDRDQFYSKYISFHEEPPAAGNESSMRKWLSVRQESKRRSLELLSRYADKGRLLCVGCGDGVEVGVARSSGWQVEGVDVDPDTTAEVARTYGVTMHAGDLLDVDLPTGVFDAVFMDQVIEHLKKPGDYLRRVHELLRPGGVLYLGVPNVGSWSNSAKTLVGKLGLKKRRGNHYSTKHHIQFFSPGVLVRLLERNYGFQVLCVRGSLKPQKKRLTPILSRWFPSADSSFLTLARKTDPR